MSPLYATTLILNLTYCIRYIEINQLKKQSKLTLVKVKKLQERYQEEVVPLPTIIPFLYNNLSREVRELNAFDQIVLSLQQVTWLASEDEYKDYIS